MSKKAEIKGYHVEQIDDFVEKQVHELKGWARGDGFFAIQAREKLAIIKSMSEKEKRAAAVKNMAKLNLPAYPGPDASPASPGL